MLIWELISWSGHANLMEDDGLWGHGMHRWVRCADLHPGMTCKLFREESLSQRVEQTRANICFPCKIVYWRVNHARSRQSAYSNQLHLNRRIEQRINMICTYFMYCVCLMPWRSHLVASPLIPTALLVIRDRFAFFRSVLPKWTLKSVSRKETSVSGRLSSGMCWTWME